MPLLRGLADRARGGSSGVAYETAVQTCIFQDEGRRRALKAAGAPVPATPERGAEPDVAELTGEVAGLTGEVAELKAQVRELVAGQHALQALLQELVAGGRAA